MKRTPHEFVACRPASAVLNISESLKKIGAKCQAICTHCSIDTVRRFPRESTLELGNWSGGKETGRTGAEALEIVGV